MGPATDNAFVRNTNHDSCAEDDIVPLFREICRPYESMISKHNFEYLLTFYAIFDHDFTDALKQYQTLTLNDVHINQRKTINNNTLSE